MWGGHSGACGARSSLRAAKQACVEAGHACAGVTATDAGWVPRARVVVVVDPGGGRPVLHIKHEHKGHFAYKALNNQDTLHINQYIIRTLCI